MYKLIRYFKHQLTATNQYGIHSPFVYNFLTKCLYAKPKMKSSKSDAVLLKSIPYFKLNRLQCIPKNQKIEGLIQKKYGMLPVTNEPFDILRFENPSSTIIAVFHEKINTGGLIFIDNIHRNKENSKNWNTLINHTKVTVSIDLFYCGLLFFRQEQVKQHFKIRI